LLEYLRPGLGARLAFKPSGLWLRTDN